MKILTRYIIKEHMGPFWFSLAVIMFVFVTKFIVRYIGKLFGKDLPFITILEFIYLNLAWMLALAVPMSVLVAALMAFGRLSADNEITILKSSGINLYRTIAPAVMWAGVLTLAMIYFNDQILPEYNHQARLLFRSISRKKPTFELEKGIYLKLDNFNILVEEVEQPLHREIARQANLLDPNYPDGNADKLKQITIFDYSDPEMQRTVIADHGYLIFDKAREQLVFHLFDGEIHEVSARDFSEYRRVSFTKNVFYIDAEGQAFKRLNEIQRGDREMTIRMMRDEVAKYRRQITEEQKKLADKLSAFLIHPDSLQQRFARASRSDYTITDAQQRNALYQASRKIQGLLQTSKSTLSSLEYFKKQINRYQVEIHKKYSIPFACLVFIFIGAPLGIRAQKGSLGVGVTFSIGFFLLYWACLIGGEELADRRLLSPLLAMWFPNILVGAMGIYLTIRTVRETSFIQWERLPKFLQVFFKDSGH